MEQPDIFQEKKKDDLPKVLRDWIVKIGSDPEEILLDIRNGYFDLSFEQFRITVKVEEDKIFIRNIVSLVKDWVVTGLFYQLVIVAKENAIKFIYAEKVDKKSAHYWVWEHEFSPVTEIPGLYRLDIDALGHFYRKKLVKPEPWFLKVSEDNQED